MVLDSIVLEDNQFRLSIYCSLFIHIIFLLILYFGTSKLQTEYKQEQELVSFEMLPASAVMNLPQMRKIQSNKSQSKSNSQIPKQISPKEIVKQAQTKTLATEVTQPAEASKEADLTEKSRLPNRTQKEEVNNFEETKKLVESVNSEVPSDTAPVYNQEAAEVNHRDDDALENGKQHAVAKKEHKVSQKQGEASNDRSKESPKRSSKTKSRSKNLRKSLEESTSSASPFDALDSQNEEEKKLDFMEDIVEEIDEKNFSTSQLYDEFNPLSITEKMLIRRQVEAHWSPPIGLDSANGIQVMIRLKLTKSANIKRLEVKNVICPRGDMEVCRLVAESTLRAVRQAMPINGLSSDRYDIWGEFDLLFDPRDLL